VNYTTYMQQKDRLHSFSYVARMTRIIHFSNMFRLLSLTLIRGVLSFSLQWLIQVNHNDNYIVLCHTCYLYQTWYKHVYYLYNKCVVLMYKVYIKQKDKEYAAILSM